MEPWQPILQELLHKSLRAERSNFSCPFTRQGLARLFELDSHLYGRLRTVSGFDLPPDPTSPHTMEGGRSFCTTHHLRSQTLEAHCGCQTGGKTCIIQPNPPAKLEDWSKYAVDQQLHYCLLKVAKRMDVFAELAPPQLRAPEQPQTFDAEICWPPALRVTGRDIPDSETRIRQKFHPDRREGTVTFTGYPVYRGPTVHAVVLTFSSAADDHLIAFDEAKVLEESLGREGSMRADFVTRQEYERWKREKEQSKAGGHKTFWADKLLTRQPFEFRNFNAERTRLSQMRQEAQARAAAERERAEKLQAELREAHKERDALMAKNEAFEAEIVRELGVQLERQQTDQKKLDEMRLATAVAEQRSRNAELAVANERRQLQQMRDAIRLRDRVMHEELRQKEAEIKRALEEGIATVETEMREANRKGKESALLALDMDHQREMEAAQKEQIRMRDHLQQLENEKEALLRQQKLDATESERKLKEKAEKLEAVQADVFEDSTVVKVEMQRRQLKQGMDMVDCTLREMCRDELTMDDALIYLKTIGEPDLAKLTGYMTEGSSRDEADAYIEATRWSACLSGAAMTEQELRYKRKPVPDLTMESFKANVDSSTSERTYSVCEKDEFATITLPNGKVNERKVHDGSWGQYIRSRYETCADKILQHMAEMHAQVMDHTDVKPAGGFPQLFWNRHTKREATPAEKMALFYHLVIDTKVREQGQALPPPSKIHADNNADLLAGCWKI